MAYGDWPTAVLCSTRHSQPGVWHWPATTIFSETSSRSGGRSFFQVPEFLELQSQNHVFEDVIGGSFEDVLMTTAEETEQFTGGAMTPNMFQFLGCQRTIMARTRGSPETLIDRVKREVWAV